MNAVEIEEAVSALADAPFDANGFPYALLEAFGNIHVKICAPAKVAEAFAVLRESPANACAKVKFILAMDGQEIQA
jgi:hypothetical protein